MKTAPPSSINARRAAVRHPDRSGGDPVPRYHLYGDTKASAEEWFANVEPLGERCRLSGWRIAPHSHPDFGQLVYVRSGRGVMAVDDKAIAFESPCVILVPSNCVHGFSYDQDTDGWVVTIADYYLRHFNSRMPPFATLWSAPDVLALSRDGEDFCDLPSAILKLECELAERDVSYMIAAEVQLMSILLVLLRRREPQPVCVEGGARSQTRIVDDYRALIERHYQHGWKMTQFAAELGVSLAQLRSACDAVAGVAPLKLLQARILSEAKRSLIFGDMTIEQLAYWLGFSDPAYFARFFRKEAGEPPAAFRAKMRRDSGRMSVQ